MYQFTKDCITGIEPIDEEHRRLFETINEAFALLKEDTLPAAAAKNLLAALKQYAATHFAHEEAYMRQIDDPELERQQKEHAAFTNKVNSFSPDAIDGANGKAVLEELLLYLSRWLYRHILGSDTLIGKLKAVKEEVEPFAFTDRYRTGIALVDEEHKRLFEILKETDTVIRAENLYDKYDKILDILAELKDYTVLHFKDEEAYMERIGYAGLEAQKSAHQAFVDKLAEINLEAVDENQQAYLDELITFLLGWLSNHILGMDKKIPAV